MADGEMRRLSDWCRAIQDFQDAIDEIKRDFPVLWYMAGLWVSLRRAVKKVRIFVNA